MLLGEARSRHDCCNLTQCLWSETAAQQHILAPRQRQWIYVLQHSNRPSACSKVYRYIRKHQQANKNKIETDFFWEVKLRVWRNHNLNQFLSTTPRQPSNSWSCKDQLKCVHFPKMPSLFRWNANSGPHYKNYYSMCKNTQTYTAS